jgi:hypothetical protein
MSKNTKKLLIYKENYSKTIQNGGKRHKKQQKKRFEMEAHEKSN